MSSPVVGGLVTLRPTDESAAQQALERVPMPNEHPAPPRFPGMISRVAGSALIFMLLAAQAPGPREEPAPGARGTNRLAGNWEGTLEVSGIALRLAFHVTQPQP